MPITIRDIIVSVVERTAENRGAALQDDGEFLPFQKLVESFKNVCQENRVESALEQSAYQVLLLMSSETEQGWTWWEKVAHLEDRYLPRVAGPRKTSSLSVLNMSNRSSSMRSASVGRNRNRSNIRGGSERSLRQQSLSPTRLASRPFLLTTLVPNITEEPRIYTAGSGKRPVGDNTRSITDSLICNMAPSALQEGIGLCSILNDTTPAGLPLGMIAISSNIDHTTSHTKVQPSALRSTSIFHQQQSASSILGGSSSSSSSSARYNPPPSSSGTLATDYGRFKSPIRSASPSYSSATMRGPGLGQLAGPPMTAVPALSSSSSHSPHYLNMSTGSEYFRGSLGVGQSTTGDINTPYASATATATRPIGLNSPLGQSSPLPGTLRAGSPDPTQRASAFRGNYHPSSLANDGTTTTGGIGRTEYYPPGTATKSPVLAFSPQSSGPTSNPAKHWSQMDTLFTRQVTKALESSSTINETEQSMELPTEAVKSGNQTMPDKSPEALKIIPPTSGEKWQLVRESMGSIAGERRPSWGSPKPKQGVGSNDVVGSKPRGVPLTPARTPARTSTRSPPLSPRSLSLAASSTPMAFERTALEPATASLDAKPVGPAIVQDAMRAGGGGSSSQSSSHATTAATATAAAPSSLSAMFRTDPTEQRDPLLQSPFSHNNNNNNNNSMSMGTGMRQQQQQQQQPWSPTAMAATNTTNSMYMMPNLVPPRPLLPYKSVESSIQLIGISGSHGAQVTPLYVDYYIYPLPL